MTSITFPSLRIVPCIPLVGVELNGCLTDRDEVDMPAPQDGEGNGHTKAHKPLKTEHQSFTVGGSWVARRKAHTAALYIGVCARFMCG